MKFVKMHGLGNDFVVVDGISRVVDPEAVAAQAKGLCDRHFGVGGDGVLLLLPSPVADVRMRIFNADGSESEMCGNGLRCSVRYAYEEGLVEQRHVTVETGAGPVCAEILGSNRAVELISVDMGQPALQREQIPMLGPPGLVIREPLETDWGHEEVTCLSMGNPHCVLFVDDVQDCDFRGRGQGLEKHPAFPQRTNVEFVQVDTPGHLRVRVWERGVGPTLACGSGACAAAVAAHLAGLAGREVTVTLPGGNLNIIWQENNHVIMSGPAAYVFEGEWER